jgi:hypothetical protein
MIKKVIIPLIIALTISPLSYPANASTKITEKKFVEMLDTANEKTATQVTENPTNMILTIKQGKEETKVVYKSDIEDNIYSSLHVPKIETVEEYLIEDNLILSNGNSLELLGRVNDEIEFAKRNDLFNNPDWVTIPLLEYNELTPEEYERYLAKSILDTSVLAIADIFLGDKDIKYSYQKEKNVLSLKVQKTGKNSRTAVFKIAKGAITEVTYQDGKTNSTSRFTITKNQSRITKPTGVVMDLMTIRENPLYIKEQEMKKYESEYEDEDEDEDEDEYEDEDEDEYEDEYEDDV